MFLYIIMKKRENICKIKEYISFQLIQQQIKNIF